MLREAYVQDAIDLDTFEEFTGLCLQGPWVALPDEVMRFKPPGPPTASILASALKSAWAD